MRAESQPRLIRALLVSLPLSLIALGVFSMIHYYRKGAVAPGEERTGGIVMRKEVSRSDLEACVETLAVTIGERRLGAGRGLEIAAKYLESSLGLSNMGYDVRRQTFSPEAGLECSNIEVELPGGARRKEIVVIGAHYDTVPDCPGANDNGTGVAALLSLANAFAGSKNSRTLRLVAFANEEPPWFQTEGMGSRQYAKRCRERGENVVAMLCLETLGYYSDEEGSQERPPGLEGALPGTANFIAFVSNRHSAMLLEEIEEAFGAASDFPFEAGVFPPEVPGVAWSDHWSFWQAGYPAVMVTDTAPFRYAHYHKPSDTPDKVDFARLHELVKGLEAVVERLANPR